MSKETWHIGKRDLPLQVKETYLTSTIGKRDLAYR
jgi:hypothetical protein